MNFSLAQRPWRDKRWLVLAPHPDDETLGAGALIRQTARTGHFAGIVYLTDGSGSHQVSTGLVAQRRREAATALFRLTGSRDRAPVHLGWKDAAPATPETLPFIRTALWLGALCRRLRVDVIAVTALHEPHCDHSAAARIAYAARRVARRRLLVAEYQVWAQARFGRGYRSVETLPMPVGQRRRALQAHRSQLTAARGPGFRLPADRQRMPATDILYLGKPR
ncbi:PIG-L deacetylase family protein [Novosphingobium sp. ZW T3_23]|uniref:PIG-L deacetylase family protein n=1 Tax=Novosphingobium sp. ZW T3_23 TaxID=3378084 RepID=UPI003854AD2A